MGQIVTGSHWQTRAFQDSRSVCKYRSVSLKFMLKLCSKQEIRQSKDSLLPTENIYVLGAERAKPPFPALPGGHTSYADWTSELGNTHPPASPAFLFWYLCGCVTSAFWFRPVELSSLPPLTVVFSYHGAGSGLTNEITFR